MGKSFKNFLEDGKVRKTEHFAYPAEIQNPISQGVRKIHNPTKANSNALQKFCKACEKFANPKLPCENPCKIKKGVQTHFTT